MNICHVQSILKQQVGVVNIILSDYRFCVIVSSSKAPVTPNGVATAFVQRSKTMSARCGIAAEYT